MGRRCRLRILYAHCFYRVPGGEDQHVRDQVDLVSRAHDVELISEANVDLEESPATAARMLYSRRKKQEVGAVIDRFVPDVLHIHNTYPSFGPSVLLAAKERGVPVVMTVHNFRLRCPNGLMFTEGAVCRRCQSGRYLNANMHRCFPTKRQAGAYSVALWTHRFLLRLEKRVVRFIVPSEFMRLRMLGWGVTEERVRLIRHFIRPVDNTAEDTRIGSYGAFVGRCSTEKGLDVVLAALHRAGDPPFLIVGDGPQRPALEMLASKLRLNNTTFLGRRSHDEVRKLLAEARYVAIPSLSEENAPLVALEALSAGRPLLVSERGGLPELVASGSGLLCRPGDEVDFSLKISRLMENDKVCRDASVKALSFARRWLGPERHLMGLMSVYGELTTQAPL
jgi:glycosyltransferase involved in cell wall biosynthesis